MRKMKKPRANSLNDPVRIFTTIERELKEKVFELAREDGRSSHEWLRVELKPLIEKRWAAYKRKQAKEAEPETDELDPVARYSGNVPSVPNVAGEVEGALARAGEDS